MVCYECRDLKRERDSFRDRALTAERRLSALEWASDKEDLVGGILVGLKNGLSVEQIADEFATHREKIVAEALDNFVSNRGPSEVAKSSSTAQEIVNG